MFAVYYRNRLTPITLTRINPIMHIIIYFFLTYFIFGKEFKHFLLSLLNSKTIQESRIYKYSVFNVRKRFFFYIAAGNYLSHRYAEFVRKFPVSGVVRGYAHYCTSTIVIEHIIGNINRYFFIGNGIYCFYAFKFNAGLFLCLHFAFKFTLFCRRCLIFRNLRVIEYSVFKFFRKLMLGRNYHKCYSEQRIAPCCKYTEFFIAVFYTEINLCTFRTSYPVSLLHFYSGQIINIVKSVEKLLCIVRNFEHPLLLFFLNYLTSATVAHSALRFFICKHNLTVRAEIDKGF